MSWTNFMPIADAILYMKGRTILAIEYNKEDYYRMKEPYRGYGSPYDRGDYDAFRGNPQSPHKLTGALKDFDLTALDVQEYNFGFEQNPTGEKDWT